MIARLSLTQHPSFLRVVLPVLVLALVGRALLIASGAVSFHADEAIVGLMARHILQGERPVFFYGQAYMGSLDSWLIAGAFRLFGESVASIRLVQSLLYLGGVASGCAAAWRLSGGNAAITRAAGLLLAVPTVLFALYTTATLGGYGETLLLGNLMLVLAFRLLSPPAARTIYEANPARIAPALNPAILPLHTPSPQSSSLARSSSFPKSFFSLSPKSFFFARSSSFPKSFFSLSPKSFFFARSSSFPKSFFSLSPKSFFFATSSSFPKSFFFATSSSFPKSFFSLSPKSFFFARSFLLGLCAGVGWWTNNLIVAYALPIAGYLLWSIWQGRAPDSSGDRPALRRAALCIALAAVAFGIGSLPWWVYNSTHGFPSLAFLFTGASNSTLAGMDGLQLSLGDRLIGTLFLGLPALIGVRAPWSGDYWQPIGGLAVFGVTVFALFRLLRRPSSLEPGARALVVGMIGGFLLMFTLSRFSMDPSGRYFLPLALPLAIAIAAGLHGLRAAPLLLAVLIVYQGGGQFAAVRQNPPGVTTQFNLQTHIPNDHDAELMMFLDAHGLTRGYTNYWIAFRLAFLSGERLVYRAVLPDKSDLTYTPRFERYAPYIQAVESAEATSLAYITANVPEVATALEAEFAAAGVTFQQAQIGAFAVYYGFAPPSRIPRPPFSWVLGDEPSRDEAISDE